MARKNTELVPQTAALICESSQALNSRHKMEWQSFRKQLLEPAMAMPEPAAAAYVKCMAETIRIVQEGERRAAGEGLTDNSLTIVWEE